jgi:hypothetical protein
MVNASLKQTTSNLVYACQAMFWAQELMKGCQWERGCCCPKKREHCRSKNAAIYSPIFGPKDISALFV